LIAKTNINKVTFVYSLFQFSFLINGVLFLIIELKRILKSLSLKRKIFYSEADFQHAFAWEIHKKYPDTYVRLEYPIMINNMWYIDILVKYENQIIPIELKYKTRKIKCSHNKERFHLKNQGAQDHGRYDFLWDIYRIEQLKNKFNNLTGYAIFLTNDSLYWKEPRKSNTVDSMFRIHNGKEVNGSLSWSNDASAGTKKGREDKILLKNKYQIKWEDYSRVNSNRHNEFKYLFLEI